ncbi:MAG: KOW motif-containing protein [Bdellovibrionales bacterium]
MAMKMKLKIRKGATVQVISGSEKGKKGTVLEVNPSRMGARVQGLRMQTHFSKQDGVQQKEGYIHYSNLKLVEGPAAKASAKSKSKSGSSRKGVG